MESKWIDFEDISYQFPSRTTTSTWCVRSKASGTPLGQIRWFGAWRQYCLYPNRVTIWNSECLNDVTTFIREQMELRKNAK